MLHACVYFTPITLYALCVSSETQHYLLHVTPRVPGSAQAKFHVDRSKTVGAKGIHADRHTNTQTVLLLLYRLALRVILCLLRLALRGYSVALLPQDSCFALAFSVASLPRALCFTLSFSVPSLPGAWHYMLASRYRTFCASRSGKFLKKVCLNRLGML